MTEQYKINWYQQDGKKIPAKDTGGAMYGYSFPTMLRVAMTMSGSNGYIGVVFARREEMTGRATWHPYAAVRDGREMDAAECLQMLNNWRWL